MTVEMVFSRDEYDGPACLEYSWVPEGRRHTIRLKPGEREGRQVDTLHAGVTPTHVEVYRLVNNDAVSLEKWQFPSGGPGTHPVQSASVEVHQRSGSVKGTVHYVGGGSAWDTRRLDPFPRPCPEI